MAGAQGEFAGVAMIRAYHLARGDAGAQSDHRADAAHGTNPATATMCGYDVRGNSHRARRATWTWTRCAGPSGRRRPASC